ncbi:MAG TPA: hypothetical protein VIS96_15670 [Terrimicrobiaceae bacterium]
MHTTDLSSWQHSHHFHTAHELSERNTRRVVALTAPEVAEIIREALVGGIA